MDNPTEEKFPHMVTVSVTTPTPPNINRILAAMAKFGTVSEARYLAGDE